MTFEKPQPKPLKDEAFELAMELLRESEDRDLSLPELETLEDLDSK